MLSDREFLDDSEGDEFLSSVVSDDCLGSRTGRAAEEPPIFKYRAGRINVSDFSTQLYCEQKLQYELIGIPGLKELGYDIEEVEIKEVTVGSSIHLARELEVHDITPVVTASREDRFAVILLNLLHSVQALLCGVRVVREVPVFGVPVGAGVFVSGIIDELRCDPHTLQIELVELKTRKTARVPGPSLKESHSLQVMMYKHLLDNLIQGHLQKSDIQTYLMLDLQKKISQSVLQFMPSNEKTMLCLDEFVSHVLSTVQALTMPSSLLLEYYSQDTNKSFSLQEVVYDESWLLLKLQNLIPFWLGQRTAEGVKDIEEAWKCRTCPYTEVCEWRLSMVDKFIAQNSRNFKN